MHVYTHTEQCDTTLSLPNNISIYDRVYAILITNIFVTYLYFLYSIMVNDLLYNRVFILKTCDNFERNHFSNNVY